MKRVFLLPTGDEIRNGLVLDTDSPAILERILHSYPEAQVCRLPPELDDEDAILRRIVTLAAEAPDLILLIGGSGGGHRHSSTLGKDYTHSALEQCLRPAFSSEIYGKNGHLWTRLICGKWENTLVVNVPGPYVEACAAADAFLAAYGAGKGLREINHAMAEAVYAQYPAGGAEGKRRWDDTVEFAKN
ncbi:MAG: hypothetical protein IJK63_09335 [Oscillospiraceae bacterium]|nr:hypothetical protein [Oscillospiraceae bacterium]